MAKITLGDSYYTGIESEGFVDICVQLKTDIKRDVQFQLRVNDATAQGSNYLWEIIY